MSDSFDVIVVGLGAMGSAASFHLARRGLKVLGLDRFAPPHTFGSSHGQTRIIREAYFEHPAYVPLVQRAYVLWDELERESGRRVLLQTGGLMLGRPDSAVASGAKLSAETHNLPHEILSAKEVQQRFPALQPNDDMVGVLEPRAGILFPEICLASHIELARRHGAALQFNEPVLNWEARRDSVIVHTAKGDYVAGQLILSAGAWINSLLRGFDPGFRVERQVLYWFDAIGQSELFSPERCPIHLWQFDDRRFFYGFPDLGEGVKVARHHDGETTTPDSVYRDVSDAEIESMRGVVRRFLPAADGALRSATVCLYTNTADEHFWIDRHPEHSAVLIASPCSGHGFKFSSAVGEVLADLITRGQSQFDLSLFQKRQQKLAPWVSDDSKATQ